MTDTPALIQRVESARGPDLDLDFEIMKALGIVPERSTRFMSTAVWFADDGLASPQAVDIPPYCSSLDAAVSLAKRVLEPGDAITIGLNIHHREWSASVNRLDPDGRPYSVAWGQSPEAFPALALVLAVLRAVG